MGIYPHRIASIFLYHAIMGALNRITEAAERVACHVEVCDCAITIRTPRACLFAATNSHELKADLQDPTQMEELLMVLQGPLIPCADFDCAYCTDMSS